jgi:hypothetical protein
MRRFGVRLAALAFLLGLLPITVSGCNITCACASTPDPNWTPPPVSAQEAQVAAAKFAAGSTGAQPSGLVASLGYSSQDHPLYSVLGPTVGAVVDAHSGLVLEFVQVDALPESSEVSISSAVAQARATSFLSDRGRDMGVLVATTTLRSGTTSAYVVTWAAQGSGVEQISVSVDPYSGTPFAFVDQRFGVRPVPPSIGAATAARLALAAISAPGELVFANDFSFGFDDSTWGVSLGVPSATASDAYEHGAFVDVDAVTGVVTVRKSD